MSLSFLRNGPREFVAVQVVESPSFGPVAGVSFCYLLACLTLH